MNERTRELFDAVAEDPTNLEAYQEVAQLLRDEEVWDSLVDLTVHVLGTKPAEVEQRTWGWSCK